MSKFIVAVKNYGVMSDEVKIVGLNEIEDLIDVIIDDSSLNQQAEEWFKDMLDQTTDPMIIGDVEYLASTHLKTIDGIMYDHMYTDYITGEIEELEYEINHMDGNVFDVQPLGISMKIIHVEGYKKEPWLFGIRSEDYDRCTFDYVFDDISALREYLIDDEYYSTTYAFNEMLNEKYGWIKIDDLEYHASQILDEVDNHEYIIKMYDWLNDTIRRNVIDIAEGIHYVIIPHCEKYAVFKVRSEAFD